MKEEGMRLRLNGLSVECIIGERPEERVREQTLRVDVELAIAPVAARTDSLADTVDYAALSERIRAALVAGRCRMIERAASLALETCLAERLVAAATVTVTKAGAVAGLESASVTLEARR